MYAAAYWMHLRVVKIKKIIDLEKEAVKYDHFTIYNDYWSLYRQIKQDRKWIHKEKALKEVSLQ